MRALHGGINYPQGKKRSLILNATYPVGPRAASGTPLNTALINDTEVVGFVNVTGSGPWPFAPRVLNKRFYDYTIRFRREDETGIKSKNTGSYTSEMKGTIGSPFTLVSSSVTTGYNKPVQQNFMSGAAVVNLHSDTYASNEIPIQGPFTNAHVGGHESRHIPVNRYNSSFASTNKIDSYENRAEAWRIELGTRFLATDPKILGFVGPDYPYPVGPYPYTPFKWAVRYRNVGAKRPVNIRNINYTTASQVLGNYQHNYQVVQTCGRRLNNRYFVDKEGIALPTTPINLKSTLPETNTLSTLLGLKYGADNLGNFVGVKPNGGVLDISDRYELLANFLIPNRSGSSKTKSIFVNRFSAPGGPEVQSLGYLDLAAAEISAYNALPFRNLSVRSSGSGESGTIRVDDQLGKRRGLRTLLTLHAGQFGYDATYGSVPELTYITKPSYQKTNRNRLKEIQFNGTATWGDNSYVTGSVYDNAYISYSIPRSDLQYAWITASYSKSRIYGHTYGNSIVSSSAEGFQQAIDFVQQSHISASTGPGAINVDFANLNTLIYDPLDLANNILSSSTAEYRNTEIATLAQPEMLNGLILHRQGPYGVTAWTQLRNANNTLTRKRRERNIISYVRRSRFSYPLESSAETLSMPKFGPIEDYVESPLVSKFAPLLQKLQVRKMMPDSSVKIVPVSLDTSYAASLSAFNNVPLNNKYNVRQDRPQPYDKIKNLYLDGADENDESPVHKFDSITYRETVYPSALNAYSSSVRVRKDYVSPFWRNNRSDRNLSSITSFGRTITNVSMWSLDADSAFLTRNPFTTKGMTGFPGILQNNYVQIHGGTPAGIEPGPSLGRRNTIGNCQSVTGPEGLMISATGSITRNINTFVALEQDQMFGGQALWEAGTQAKKNPWYNSYDDYVSEMRLKGKEYSIVPEFTISTHIDQYVKDYGGDFLVDNDKFLIMTGGITSKDKSNEDGFYRTYTNSDFLKFFSVVREDHNEIGTPASIALQCRGLLKFLPYDGFYPSERSIDIAQTFSSSYGSFMSYSLGGGITSIEGQQAMLRPLFAPGILYNTIKAGVAVDFPIMTSSVDFHTTANDTSAATGTRYISGSNGTGRFGLRLPFETLVEPETYLADITVVDMETHPSAALDATASWSGDGSPIYKLKANNFFAETINFFLPESKPTTIVSRPQSAWEPAEKDKVYAARIKMRKSYNKAVIRTGSLGYRNPLTPVDQWRGDLHTTFTQCSAPFMYGPPVGAGTANTVAYASADGFNPCFTPPYEYGEAWADVFFTAPAAGKFTIDELLSPTNLAVSFLRIGSDWALGNAKGTALALNTILDGANIEFNSMQLDASMNLFGKAQIKKVTYDPNTGEPISVEDDPNDNAWTIQTKFETPMLNFAKASVTNPTNGSGSVPRCMWMQYGEVPTNPTEGIFISVVDIPPNYIEGALGGDSSLTGSLVELVGSGTEEQRLGEIATARTISEAIVAIPYYEKGSERRFIDISRAEIDKALAPQPTASGQHSAYG